MDLIEFTQMLTFSYLSLFIHELGHYFVGTYFFKCRGLIYMTPYGGYTLFHDEKSWSEIWVKFRKDRQQKSWGLGKSYMLFSNPTGALYTFLAGPMAGILFCLPFLFCNLLLRKAALLGLFGNAFNLLPFVNYDGYIILEVLELSSFFRKLYIFTLIFLLFAINLLLSMQY